MVINYKIRDSDCDFTQPAPDVFSRFPRYLRFIIQFPRALGIRQQSVSYSISMGVSHEQGKYFIPRCCWGSPPLLIQERSNAPIRS